MLINQYLNIIPKNKYGGDAITVTGHIQRFPSIKELYAYFGNQQSNWRTINLKYAIAKSILEFKNDHEGDIKSILNEINQLDNEEFNKLELHYKIPFTYNSDDFGYVMIPRSVFDNFNSTKVRKVKRKHARKLLWHFKKRKFAFAIVSFSEINVVEDYVYNFIFLFIKSIPEMPSGRLII